MKKKTNPQQKNNNNSSWNIKVFKAEFEKCGTSPFLILFIKVLNLKDINSNEKNYKFKKESFLDKSGTEFLMEHRGGDINRSDGSSSLK